MAYSSAEEIFSEMPPADNDFYVLCEGENEVFVNSSPYAANNVIHSTSGEETIFLASLVR